MLNDDESMADLAIQSIGNYRLLRLLGQGGAASVYLGEQRYLKRLAAVKVLRTVLNNRDKEYFLAEARLLANLSHPNIIRVHEFAVTQKRNLSGESFVEYVPYLVMDFAVNGNLRSVYPSGSCLFFDEVIRYVNQIAAALQYAHDHGIIHRDVKPENCLLNERQEVMLSDFGLALFAPTPDVLTTQQMAGTLPYSAPEQLRGKPGFASDQYSLAVMAYEWLCGKRPFIGEDVEVIMKHLYHRPPDLHSKNLAISQAIEEVIFRALEKDPQRRFPNVLAFAQALEHAYQQVNGSTVYRPAHVRPSSNFENERLDTQPQENLHSTEPRLGVYSPEPRLRAYSAEKKTISELSTAQPPFPFLPRRSTNKAYLIFVGIVLFLLVVGGNSVLLWNAVKSKEEEKASPETSWHFLWGDDFNGADHTGIDRKNWMYDIGSGYPGGPHQWGTVEADTMSDSLANVSLDGHGHLLIRPTLDSQGHWISGRIETVRSDFAAPPGGEIAVQASIRMPDISGEASLGYWSTLWMLGTPFRGNYNNWPGVGQINVAENVNGLNEIYGTLHCGVFPEGPCNEPTGIAGKASCALTTCLAGFHTYRVEYDRRTSPEQIRWYLDGREYWQVSSNSPGMDPATWDEALHHPFFLVLDVAIGGYLPSVHGGGPTSATVAGVPMVFDYIHVYTMG